MNSLVLCLIAAAVLSCAAVQAQSAPISVIILPNSHDDVGWLETITGYYDSRVHNIYSTVMQSLGADPRRKFQSVEMAYFFRWFVTATPQEQQEAVQYINAGRLEFITAGWAMPDESDIDYISALNGMSTGHEFVLDAFGSAVLPRFSFHVDPFGATKWIATMYARMGFDAHIISRVNFDLKSTWAQNKQLEFFWDTVDPSAPGTNINRTSIFTHMMDKYSYCSPAHAYYWDSGSPAVDSHNVKSLADDWVKNVKERAPWFKSNTLLWSWGCDFEHFNSTVMFQNMDKIVDYVNAHTAEYGVSVRYGMLSDYYNELSSYQLTFDNYQGDFEPYNDDTLSYWTGYYTSRPVLKGLIRKMNNVLMVAENLHIFSQILTANSPAMALEFINVTNLRRAVGESTHHDGVSGTSTTPVCQMYIDHLTRGANAVSNVITAGISRLVLGPQAPTNAFTLDGSSLVGLAPGFSTVAAVYNPLGWSYPRVVHFVADPSAKIAVMDLSSGNYISSCQLNPSGDLFVLTTLPAFGYKMLKFVNLNATMSAPACAHGIVTKQTVIKTNHYTMVFNPTTNLLDTVVTPDLGSISFHQEFLNYPSVDSGFDGRQTSGAYIFSPAANASPARGTKPVTLKITVGPLVVQADQVYGTAADSYRHSFRAYIDTHDEVGGFIETLTTMGPLPENIEAVTRFNTSINNGADFYTDSNGLYMLKRTVNASSPQPIAGNYYPMVMQAHLLGNVGSTAAQFSLISERSHGFTSLANGVAEVMMHRHPGASDGKGPVDDDSDQILNVPLWITVGAQQRINRLRHKFTYFLNYKPTIAFTPQSMVPEEKLIELAGGSGITYSFSGLANPLPWNIHLVSFQARSPTPMFQDPIPGTNTAGAAPLSRRGKMSESERKIAEYVRKHQAANANSSLVVVRLQHLYENNEDSSFSTSFTTDVASLFNQNLIAVSSVTERTLSGVWGTDRYNERMQWRFSGVDQQYPEPTETLSAHDAQTAHAAPAAASSSSSETSGTYTLTPMDLRTFYLNTAQQSDVAFNKYTAANMVDDEDDTDKISVQAIKRPTN